MSFPAADVVASGLAALWLIVPASIITKVGRADLMSPLTGAVAAVLAILAAVVTFLCSALYESGARRIHEGRLLLGAPAPA